MDIFKPLIDLVKKLFPSADKRLEVLLAIETLRTRIKQPILITLLSLSVFWYFAIKSIIFKIKLIVYFNTPEWYFDATLVLIAFSFVYGVPFKDIVKAGLQERKERKK